VTVINRYISDFAGLEIPVIEVVGDKPGPLLSVVAGVHGCEYASMAGLRRWAGDLTGRSLRGTVRAVPVVNLTAFWARSPFVVPEDGKNLNRCFPGSPDGTLAERLADAVFRRVITGSDAFVDIRSTSTASSGRARHRPAGGRRRCGSARRCRPASRSARSDHGNFGVGGSPGALGRAKTSVGIPPAIMARWQAGNFL
jgi:Succinylglutamate desuccinylase / Aspartoacylase family